MEAFFHDERPPNYREHANAISAFTFWWTRKIFSLGKQRDLFEADLPEPLKEHTASFLGEKIARLWSKEYARAKSKQEIPSLTKVLCQCFMGEYCLYGLALIVIELILKPLQPLFIGLLVRYFSSENEKNTNPEAFPMYFWRVFYYNHPNQSAIQMGEAYVFATGVVLCSVITVTMQHPYMLAVMHLGMKIRVACMSLLYRKTLRMSLLTLSPSTVGNVVNLMSNDAARFDMVMMFIHYLWICPVQLVLFIYIMYVFVGVSAFVGSCVIFVFIPIQLFLAYLNKGLRWRTANKTDERVRLMNEIIAGIQVIKMYAWEFAFCKLIHTARRREMNILVQTSYIRGLVMSMIMFTSRVATFITLITFVLLFKHSITSETVFIITGYWIIMRSSMTLFFPQGVTQFAETLITIRRTRDYLLNEDAIIGDPSVLNPTVKETPPEIIEPISSEMSFALFETSQSPSIRLIEVFARWHKKVVLRDVEFEIKNKELVVLIGRVGAGKSSLLHVILKELPVLSGYVSVKGQVSYASQEPWLFVGSVRQNILFGHEYNKDRYRKVCKVCALLKDFKLLPYGDQTVVGERGISLSGGQRARINLARCIYKHADIYIMDDPLSAVDTHVGAEIFKECITHFLKNKIRVLVTHQLQYLEHVDQLVIMEKGRVLARGTYHELQSSGLNFAQFLNIPGETDAKSDVSTTSLDLQRSISIMSRHEGMFFDDTQVRESLLETRGTGIVSCKLYKQYMVTGGNWGCISLVIFMFLITQTFASASDYFIGQWVKIEELKTHRGEAGFGFVTSLSAYDCIITYSVITELLILSSIARSIIFFYVCLLASIKLHNDMFESIIFGHMRFFNTNPSGRILNRFSKDMGAVDEDLPYAMIDFSQMMLNLVGSFFILSFTNYYLILPISLIIVCVFFVRNFYLKTSRSLKRIEGVARSYVFAHLNASIQGLSTIRSHGAETILTFEFDRHMDVHSSSWYLFIATARAFSVWADLLCVSLNFISAYGFLLLQTIFNFDIMAGDVGLCITQCMTLTGLIPWGLRQSAEMENHMTSVERIIDFTQIEHEADIISPPDRAPPRNWPTEGEIIFKDMELRYSQREAPVLKSLNIIIHPREKIGIVGRTGAGKSSLISAMFRLAYQSGSIFIDGVNIFTIGLHELRKKVAIIPQEPVIFTGTLRFNLDPFRQQSDETLLSALSIVDLEMGKRNILNKPLSEGGSDFSAGQKQLLCLARAIVRNSRILILDEATANMDPQTDRLIQSTIRKNFDQCTVLTIAHRLQTIMDSDRVLVMQSGNAVEFNHPHILLQNHNGYFYSMVEQTGRATADLLKQIAEQTFNSSRRQSADSHMEEET